MNEEQQYRVDNLIIEGTREDVLLKVLAELKAQSMRLHNIGVGVTVVALLMLLSALGGCALWLLG